MINAIMVINNCGKPRLTKFYKYFTIEEQQKIIIETFDRLSRRDFDNCNFLELPSTSIFCVRSSEICKLIYKNYATLFFVFCVDANESELGILDLIQIFVESLDRSFSNVCELDLIFNIDSINYILDEIIQSGLVLETNINNIIVKIEEQNRIKKHETSPASALRNLNTRQLKEKFRNFPKSFKD